jgi:hypothetical protein
VNNDRSAEAIGSAVCATSAGFMVLPSLRTSSAETGAAPQIKWIVADAPKRVPHQIRNFAKSSRRPPPAKARKSRET